MVKKLKKILFFAILTFSLQGCVLNSFDNYRKGLVSLKIKPILNNNHLEFSLKSDKYKTLKYYSLNVIRVDRINSDCISYDLMWEYLVTSLEEISVNTSISYGVNGQAEKLQKNTLYLTTVRIKKVDTLESKNMLPKISGRVLFYIDDFGKIISSTDSEQDRNNMCMKVKF
jgi:hypothetical protein